MTKATKNNRFQGGFKGSTYDCRVCGKKTRETGHDESSVELCAFCYQEAGLENALSDGIIEQAEFDADMATLRAFYKMPAAPTSPAPAPVKKTVAKEAPAAKVAKKKAPAKTRKLPSHPKNKSGAASLDSLCEKPFVEEVYRDSDGIWLDLAPGYCTTNECIGLRGDTVLDLRSQIGDIRVCPCGRKQNHGDEWFEAAEAIREQATPVAAKVAKVAKAPTAKQVAAAEKELDALDAATEKRNAKVLAKLPKVAIVDACAAKGCFTPPAETLDGVRYCSEHATAKVDADLEVKLAAKAKKAAKTIRPHSKGNHRVLGVKTGTSVAGPKKAKASKPAPKPQSPREEVAKLLADSAHVSVVAKSQAPAEASSKDARPVLSLLFAKGWTPAAVAERMETSAGHVYQWRNGSGCRRIGELEKLLKGAVPAKPERKARTSKKASSEPKGALRAPSASAAKARALPFEDPRQLVLNLQNLRAAIDAVLGDAK